MFVIPWKTSSKDGNSVLFLMAKFTSSVEVSRTLSAVTSVASICDKQNGTMLNKMICRSKMLNEM